MEEERVKDISLMLLPSGFKVICTFESGIKSKISPISVETKGGVGKLFCLFLHNLLH